MVTKENPCTVIGCDKSVHGRGYCSAHYQRWRTHGDPLLGRTPVGTPLKWIEDVALCFAGEECLIWPFARGSKGYGTIHLDGKYKIVSRFVCEKAHGSPPTPSHEAAHSCGMGHMGCVHPGHLSWKSMLENEADKLKHGTIRRGERHGNSKLSIEDVRRIRVMSSEGMTQFKIADRFGINQATVSEIVNRKAWSWMPAEELYK